MLRLRGGARRCATLPEAVGRVKELELVVVFLGCLHRALGGFGGFCAVDCRLLTVDCFTDGCERAVWLFGDVGREAEGGAGVGVGFLLEGGVEVVVGPGVGGGLEACDDRIELLGVCSFGDAQALGPGGFELEGVGLGPGGIDALDGFGGFAALGGGILGLFRADSQGRVVGAKEVELLGALGGFGGELLGDERADIARKSFRFSYMCRRSCLRQRLSVGSPSLCRPKSYGCKAFGSLLADG